MVKNSLEFDWCRQEELYQVGQGVIATPYEQIKFVVKSPYELLDSHPVEFFPGFTDGVNGAERITNALAEFGKIALTLSYPRSEHPDFKDDPEGHKVNSAMLVLSAFRSLFPDALEADAEGHSEGGSNASRACLEFHEEFRTLIVMGSGGLIAGDSQAKITKRALKNPQTFIRLTGQMLSHPGYSATLAKSTVGYVWENPLKARREAVRIASADIRHRFQVLSSRVGIPTGALQFNNDSLFPLNLVMASTSNGDIFDVFRVYPYHDATHITPQNHPRTTAAQAIDMTENLVEIIVQRQKTTEKVSRLVSS